MKKLLTMIGLAASVFTLSHSAHAQAGYTIQKGDTLSKLSKKFHVTVSALKKNNHISGNLIRIGAHIKIPAAGSSVVKASSKTLSPKTKTASTSTPTHKVKKGESLWGIAITTGASMASIKSANHLSSPLLDVGQTLKIPQRFAASEKKLFAQLVTAEAKGEPYAGQVAVATVILNRIDSNKFPNTLKGVIYQKNAFTPVKTGSINKPATASSKKAVNEAIAMHGYYKKIDSLYYYNRKLINDRWILSRPITAVIGHQTFAK
jgi:N-acetylmuramoyl-L-alanine amidase